MHGMVNIRPGACSYPLMDKRPILRTVFEPAAVDSMGGGISAKIGHPVDALLFDAEVPSATFERSETGNEVLELKHEAYCSQQ